MGWRAWARGWPWAASWWPSPWFLPGRGRRSWWFWPFMFGGYFPYAWPYAPYSPEEEMEFLKGERSALEEELRRIEERLKELEEAKAKTKSK